MPHLFAQPDEQPTLAPTVEKPDSAMDEVEEPDEEKEGGLAVSGIQEDVDAMPDEA
jgi:hypothetical protein